MKKHSLLRRFLEVAIVGVLLMLARSASAEAPYRVIDKRSNGWLVEVGSTTSNFSSIANPDDPAGAGLAYKNATGQVLTWDVIVNTEENYHHDPAGHRMEPKFIPFCKRFDNGWKWKTSRDVAVLEACKDDPRNLMGIVPIPGPSDRLFIPMKVPQSTQEKLRTVLEEVGCTDSADVRDCVKDRVPKPGTTVTPEVHAKVVAERDGLEKSAATLKEENGKLRKDNDVFQSTNAALSASNGKLTWVLARNTFGLGLCLVLGLVVGGLVVRRSERKQADKRVNALIADPKKLEEEQKAWLSRNLTKWVDADRASRKDPTQRALKPGEEPQAKEAVKPYSKLEADLKELATANATLAAEKEALLKENERLFRQNEDLKSVKTNLTSKLAAKVDTRPGQAQEQLDASKPAKTVVMDEPPKLVFKDVGEEAFFNAILATKPGDPKRFTDVIRPYCAQERKRREGKSADGQPTEAQCETQSREKGAMDVKVAELQASLATAEREKADALTRAAEAVGAKDDVERALKDERKAVAKSIFLILEGEDRIASLNGVIKRLVQALTNNQDAQGAVKDWDQPLPDDESRQERHSRIQKVLTPSASDDNEPSLSSYRVEMPMEIQALGMLIAHLQASAQDLTRLRGEYARVQRDEILPKLAAQYRKMRECLEKCEALAPLTEAHYGVSEEEQARIRTLNAEEEARRKAVLEAMDDSVSDLSKMLMKAFGAPLEEIEEFFSVALASFRKRTEQQKPRVPTAIPTAVTFQQAREAIARKQEPPAPAPQAPMAGISSSTPAADAAAVLQSPQDAEDRKAEQLFEESLDHLMLSEPPPPAVSVPPNSRLPADIPADSGPPAPMFPSTGGRVASEEDRTREIPEEEMRRIEAEEKAKHAAQAPNGAGQPRQPFPPARDIALSAPNAANGPRGEKIHTSPYGYSAARHADEEGRRQTLPSPPPDSHPPTDQSIKDLPRPPGYASTPPPPPASADTPPVSSEPEPPEASEVRGVSAPAEQSADPSVEPGLAGEPTLIGLGEQPGTAVPAPAERSSRKGRRHRRHGG